MESTVAEQSRDFARRFFALITELDHDGWLSANDAFARTLEAHPDHPYAAYVTADRVRRAGFAAAAEQIRQAEFPQIERRKAGVRSNAPVFYRTWRPGTGLAFDLPYRAPPRHPLRATRRDRHHALRRAPEDVEPRSPWRQRGHARRARPDTQAEGRQSLIAGWWHAITKWR